MSKLLTEAELAAIEQKLARKFWTEDRERLLADFRRYREWCEWLVLEMRPESDPALWGEVRAALEESK